MNLKEFKYHIESFPKGTDFKYGISNPFSWRGSYDEVAFSIVESPTKREDILEKIELAFEGRFYGHKGGEYTFGIYTPVNFEEERSRWSDGKYAADIISKIEGNEAYESQEKRLVKIAFC